MLWPICHCHLPFWQWFWGLATDLGRKAKGSEGHKDNPFTFDFEGESSMCLWWKELSYFNSYLYLYIYYIWSRVVACVNSLPWMLNSHWCRTHGQNGSFQQKMDRKPQFGASQHFSSRPRFWPFEVFKLLGLICMNFSLALYNLTALASGMS